MLVLAWLPYLHRCLDATTTKNTRNVIISVQRFEVSGFVVQKKKKGDKNLSYCMIMLVGFWLQVQQQ